VKIGIVCYPTYGGSGVVASELALAMSDRGDEVHVLSYALPPRIAAEGPEHGVVFHEVKVPPYPLFEYPPYSLALASKMVEVARRHRLDLLHVHYAVPNAVSAILARQILGKVRAGAEHLPWLPVVTTLHGTDVTLVGNDPSYLETTRFGVLESDAVTAVSWSLRERTLRQLAIDREIEVIPNFVDARRTEPPPRIERTLTTGGERLLVHVSNFRPVKRLADVVEVFRRVREQVPCRLALVGDGPERAEALRRLSSAGLAEATTVLGTLDRVERVLWQADLLLLPSEEESFGLAALEALACGAPVIATRVGGLPEVVPDGEAGLLFAVGDTAGMAAGALRLLRDEAERRRMSEAGRRWAISRFDREAIVERYRALYRETLVRSRAGEELARSWP
jgi:N-acetyl-alpha-D-glucosaminyl L-malate synthase BshA